MLESDLALVTGASRGIGRAIALALGAAGATVVGTATTEQGAQQLAADFTAAGIAGRGLVWNAAEPASTDALIEQLETSGGLPTILVNNAGVARDALILRMKSEDWEQTLQINLSAVFRLSKACLRRMLKQRHGRIINIGSVTSVFGYAGLTPYCASRGGVKQMTMSLADDWGKHGITVNCLAPGWFKTKQNAVLYENKEWLEYIVDRIPMKRPGAPADLDGAVVFLASDASEYFTGHTMLVDGGISTGATRATVAK